VTRFILSRRALVTKQLAAKRPPFARYNPHNRYVKNPREVFRSRVTAAAGVRSGALQSDRSIFLTLISATIRIEARATGRRKFKGGTEQIGGRRRFFATFLCRDRQSAPKFSRQNGGRFVRALAALNPRVDTPIWTQKRGLGTDSCQQRTVTTVPNCRDEKAYNGRVPTPSKKRSTIDDAATSD
jgi:hypothetical protein